jgi:hypothetical protein
MNRNVIVQGSWSNPTSIGTEFEHSTRPVGIDEGWGAHGSTETPDPTEAHRCRTRHLDPSERPLHLPMRRPRDPSGTDARPSPDTPRSSEAPPGRPTHLG